jgi:transposase-like protein
VIILVEVGRIKMSERLTLCNNCESSNFEVLKIINPETTDMNMKAKLKCKDCKFEDKHLILSFYHEDERESGWAR